MHLADLLVSVLQLLAILLEVGLGLLYFSDHPFLVVFKAFDLGFEVLVPGLFRNVGDELPINPWSLGVHSLGLLEV